MKNGKEIEAVYFVYEAGLTEQFPPLPLLKTHLSNSRKIANNISKKGKYSMSAVVCGKNSSSPLPNVISIVHQYWKFRTT